MNRAKIGGMLFVVLLAGSPARADTVLPGGTVVNQTWTRAGSPYIVQGDLVVPAGAYLHIQAGVVVRFESSDNLGSGLNANLVELTVNGELAVEGTETDPVIFEPRSGTSPGSWYGLVITNSASSASIRYAEIRYAERGLTNQSDSPILSVAYLTIESPLSGGLYQTGAGTSSVDHLTVRGIAGPGAAVRVAGAGGVQLTNCLLVDNVGNYGVFVVGSATDTLVDHCTIDGGYRGVYSSYSSSRVVVQNSNITNHTSYGIYEYSGDIQVHHCNVWNNASGSFYGTSCSSGCLSANPLYVGSGNYRITSNSPSRFAADDGSDLGPLPYAGDETPGPNLYGVLWSNTHLTAANSPYYVSGDLTLAAGVALTVDPGVELVFLNSDVMRSGVDTTRPEFVLQGTLVAEGIPSEPIVFRNAPGSDPFEIVFRDGSEGSRISWIEVRQPYHGLRFQQSGTVSLSHVSIFSSQYTSVVVEEGTAVLDALAVFDSGGDAVNVLDPARVELSNCLLVDSSSYSVRVSSGNILGTKVVNCTLVGGYRGVYLNHSQGRVTVSNSIVTDHTSYGIYESRGTIDVGFSNVWNNASGAYYGTSCTGGCISANPLFVDPVGGDYHLQGSSLCVDAGTDQGAPDHDLDGVARPLDGDGINGPGYDMGAYEYRPASYCGDGVVDPGEACDDGLANGMYGHCKADCSGLGPHCGDGVVDPGHEECDDGNTSNTDGCLDTCVAARCGDGYVWAGHEECDDGNTSNTDGCLDTCVAARCGDGYVWAGHEECDDGNANSDTEPDACRTDCRAARCGDGVVDSGEGCDDGNQVDTDGCTNECRVSTCGDGVVQEGEECDDGNTSNTDGCLDTCVAARCGDGYVWAGHEECDDGNQVDTDGCTSDCRLAQCGDGVVQPGEECDEGSGNSDTEPDACRTDCRLAYCGDGVVDSSEECDDGNQQDDDGCTNECRTGRCGDGVVQEGEECDDGNDVDTDACRTNCRLNVCGDGVLLVGQEECDDGNRVSGDGCSPECRYEESGTGGASSGCGCRATGSPLGSLPVVLLLVLVLRRRRMDGTVTL